MRKLLAFYHALPAILVASSLLLLTRPARAQQTRQVMQFTGLVVQGDSLIGVASATVSIPGSRRATLTNEVGYFSLPVLAGDRVTVRYHEQVQYVAIPTDYQGLSYSAVVRLPNGPQALPPPTEFQSQFLRLPSAKASYYDVRPIFYDSKSLKDTFRQVLK